MQIREKNAIELTTHHLFLFLSFFFCHTFKPLPFRGTGPWSQVINHLSPVHALDFGLADLVSTPAPRHLSTNAQLNYALDAYAEI